MAMLVAVQRNFITRADALGRITTIVNFLTNKASTYHGAFSHWINGSTGATIPFSTQDDGADLVETSFLMEGLLTARQYFKSDGAAGKELYDRITRLWEAVEWNWFASMPSHDGREGPYAAASTRAISQWANSLSIARTRSSIMASVWKGVGVKRRRSVPRGTVG